jgi:hypothetical protein
MKNEGLKPINLSENYTIKREWEKIDLLIEDENSVIVIENKILSNINGVKGKDIDGKLKSQLDKYYDLVNEKAKVDGKKAYFFLLHPKYNEIDLQKYKCGESYIKITYLDVCNCFSKIKDEIKDNYFFDFVMALGKHASDYDNTLKEEMQDRFFKKIQETKEQQ